jgi:hypothetical protein
MRPTVLLLTFVLSASSALAQYCAATTMNALCTDEYVSRVNFTIGTNDHATTCTSGGGYEDFTGALIPEYFVGGGAFTVEVTVANYVVGDVVTVWTDFDGDGSFAAAEATELLGDGLGLFSGTIFVPYTCIPVLGTRLRVALGRNVGSTAPACGPVLYGEREDYPVDVHPGGPNVCMSASSGPVAAFTVFNGTPGALFLAAFTANVGAYPNGWWFGIDIPFTELVLEFQAGFPFLGTLDVDGYFQFSFPNPGLGLTLYGVTAEFGGPLVITQASNTVVITI